ncbi:MAG: HIT domain-containing protein [Candidatus Paceibacterota bacterium]
MNENCLFCKIITGVIPSSIVYEDAEFFAFLDIHPVAKGHTLLIPKTHHVWMHDTPDEILAKAFVTAKILMNTMRANIPCDYVQISVVGKDIPHFHIHLIPRFFNDTIPQSPTVNYSSDEEMKVFALKLANPRN